MTQKYYGEVVLKLEALIISTELMRQFKYYLVYLGFDVAEIGFNKEKKSLSMLHTLDSKAAS